MFLFVCLFVYCNQAKFTLVSTDTIIITKEKDRECTQEDISLMNGWIDALCSRIIIFASQFFTTIR